MSCKLCDGEVATYIGETGRSVGVRVAEHLKPIKDGGDLHDISNLFSQVQKHSFNVHGSTTLDDWNVEVLRRANNIQDRKVLESMDIQELKPTYCTGFHTII